MKKILHLLLIVIFFNFNALHGMENSQLDIKTKQAFAFTACYLQPKEKNILMRLSKELHVFLKKRKLSILKANLYTVNRLDKCKAMINYACAGDIQMIKLLIKKGINTRYQNEFCASVPLNSALVASLFKNHMDIVKFVVNAGADINCENNQGWTPLCFAAYYCGVEAVKLLLDHGADMSCVITANITKNPIIKKGDTPLMIAHKKNRFDVVKILQEHDSSIMHWLEVRLLKFTFEEDIPQRITKPCNIQYSSSESASEEELKTCVIQ